MSDYENRTTSARHAVGRAPGGGSKAIFWVLGIVLLLVFSILFFAGSDPGPAIGPDGTPAPAAVPDAPIAPDIPGQSPVAPQ